MQHSEPSMQSDRWPATRSPLLDWLVRDAAAEPFIDDVLVQMCNRIQAEGIAITRANLIVRTLHPQWLGARMLWRPGQTKADMLRFDYEGLDRLEYIQSPVKAVFDGADEIRAHLDQSSAADDAYPILDDFRREGLTDYVVWPLLFTRGQRHVMSFATDRPGGFTADEMATLRDIIPVFTLLTEIRLRNRLARTFLETYVGPHASEQILAGLTRRGSGVTVEAVIVIFDLRGFTALSELWPRDDVIAMLNDYFDAIADPVSHHGGEILKFMGDGMLAIFPLDNPDACLEALRAVTDARTGMAVLNARRQAGGLDPLGYGVGVHVGDVMYGNIGSRSRLDFTVIGPAVNVASRLEGLTKTVGRTILLSGEFVRLAEQEAACDALGALTLPGVSHAMDVFALNNA